MNTPKGEIYYPECMRGFQNRELSTENITISDNDVVKIDLEPEETKNQFPIPELQLTEEEKQEFDKPELLSPHEEMKQLLEATHRERDRFWIRAMYNYGFGQSTIDRVHAILKEISS